MDIIFHGKHQAKEAVESIEDVIRLLHERYHIEQFREMHLSITLVDSGGEDVELIDTNTSEAYRTFEVYRHGQELLRSSGRPTLKLVINNDR